MKAHRITPRLGLLFGFCLAAGCSHRTEFLDRREERDPLIQRAQAKQRENDIEGAIELYNKALARKPDLAMPHLELGVLYDDKQKNFVRAIYHYERYLELRPDAEKKKFVEELIQYAKLSFAASLPDRPSGAVEQIAALQRENQMLKNKLAQLTQPGGAAPATKATNLKSEGGGTAPGSGRSGMLPPPAPPQQAVQTYRVQTGDTLTSIAKKMYNDTAEWEKIYNANRGLLKTTKDLKAGQTLVIPR